MAQPLQSSLLLRGEPTLAPDGDPRTAPQAGRLWLAVHLALPDPRAALEMLAARALRFTPIVSLEPPDGLLLEVAGSLRLFGGLAAIKSELATEIELAVKIEEPPATARLCAAPTPLAALWLARCGQPDALAPQALAGRLSPLPCAVTRWPADTLALLRDMGVRTLGDCLRLPRGGFARRVGRHHLIELDEALGRRWVQRETFELERILNESEDFGEESKDRKRMAAAHARMLERLVRELRRRQAQVPCLELVFHHRRGAPTLETVRLVEPAHEAERLLALLGDRLERIVLPAPVVTVELRAGPLLPMRLEKASLFSEPAAAERAAASVLIERLRGRFGAERVYGLTLAADHRPERAWRKVVSGLLEKRVGVAPVSPWASHRPSWLLPSPLPLGPALEHRLTAMPQPFATGLADQDPVRGVRLESGPERIETGWWDGGDALRDYYTVITARGERLWVYRRRDGRREWYLHGIFG